MIFIYLLFIYVFVFSIIGAFKTLFCNDTIPAHSGEEMCCALVFLIIIGVILGIIILSVLIYGLDSLGYEVWTFWKDFAETHHLRIVVDKL